MCGLICHFEKERKIMIISRKTSENWESEREVMNVYWEYEMGEKNTFYSMSIHTPRLGQVTKQHV